MIGPAVFAGYWDNPEANAKSFRNGWFRTGDLGHVDAEGFLYITGRASDMYISGGSNVYPREIEEKILTHPAVTEVAVVGVPDPLWGEVGIAVCVASPGASVDEAELAAFLRGQGRALQAAEALRVLGRAAEIRLRQDHQEDGARGAGPARPARRRADPGMTTSLRLLKHPGPRAADRRQAVRTRLKPLEATLAAGRTVMDEVGALFAAQDCKGGVLWLDGAACDPMRFVLPAYAQDDQHAAYYSETHAPEGPVTIGAATASVGWRDGAPFLHCHGQWQGAFGAAMGHLLPFDSTLAADARVRGLGATDAWFEGLPDAETNFTLFAAAGDPRPDGDGLVARLRPDEDVCEAIAALCAEHGLARARIHGLGSICIPAFADGRRVDCVATEVRIDDGRVADGRATIDVSLVDVDGGIHRGRLAPGLNPVGVTFELLIEGLA